MANTFTDLTTDSKPESLDFQSNRSKDGFPKITPGDHPSPDSDRTSFVPVAGDGTKGVDMPSGPTPQIEPTL